MSQREEWRSPGWRRFYRGTLVASGLLLPGLAVRVAVGDWEPWPKVGFCAVLACCWAYQLRLLPQLWRV